MACEISTQGAADSPIDQLTYDELVQILDDALRCVSPPRLRWLHGSGCISAWLRRDAFFLGDDYLAIGYFNESGAYTPLLVDGRRLHPRGDHVQVRRVCDPDSGTFFGLVSDSTTDGVRTVAAGYINCMTGPNIGNCNIFVHERCFDYLQAWLAPTAQPRLNTLGEPLSLAGELYELVNSRYTPPVVCVGTLPAIEYGPILGTRSNDEWGQWQDYFMGGRDGSRHTARAIQRGLRGADLVPALLDDFNTWMFMRPDAWPPCIHPLSLPNSLAAMSHAEEPSPALARLPSELYPDILQHLELPAVVGLAASCRAVRTRVSDAPTLAHGLRRAIMSREGPMHWILPVPEEEAGARDAMWTWDDRRPASALELLRDGGFPLFAFVRACYLSGPMRARRRRWELIGQFNALWEAYRREGWERDDFMPAGVDFEL